MDGNDEKVLAEERMALEKMVESEGWRIFVRNTQAQLDNLRQHGWSSIKTMEQLWYAKGCMDTMHSCINFEKMLSVQEEMDLSDG
jgi:hypothetical protein